jgi:hypothetical protein
MKLVKIIGREFFAEVKIRALIGIGKEMYLWSKLKNWIWARRDDDIGF